MRFRSFDAVTGAAVDDDVVVPLLLMTFVARNQYDSVRIMRIERSLTFIINVIVQL